MLRPSQFAASVIITTRNRKEELREAIKSALSQTVRVEVLVIDDGSTDGTSDCVRLEFPNIVLQRHEESKGLIVRRNEGVKFANSPVVFSIDDDAKFSTPYVVEQTLKDFDDLRIGAVAIPYIEPCKDNCLRQSAPDCKTIWLTDRFIGTAHALRREVFLKLGGYREYLVHQGEEGDFCIRMLKSGYFVRLGNADAIIHYESPKRNLQRMDYYGCRNSILFVWQNLPAKYLMFCLLATSANSLRWTWVPNRLLIRLAGLVAGYCACFTVQRLPVSSATYQQWRKMARSRGVPLS